MYLNSADTSNLFVYEEQITLTSTWKSFDMIDIDNDGDDDFIGARLYSTQIQLITNISGGTFSAPDLYYTTPCSSVAALYTDDFDGDADIDFMYVCTTTENVTLAIFNLVLHSLRLALHALIAFINS